MIDPIAFTNPPSLCLRGDTNSVTIQSVDPDIEQEPIPEDLGKLTEVDKARIGRVSFPFKITIQTKAFSAFGSIDDKQCRFCWVPSYFMGVAQSFASIYLSR